MTSFKVCRFVTDNILKYLNISIDKNNICLTLFYDMLMQMLQLDNIHIVLCDFNVNAQDQVKYVQQLVKDSTHLAGATLESCLPKKEPY